MSNLIAVAYDDVPTAQNVLDTLSELTKEHAIALDDGGAMGAMSDVGVDDNFMKSLGEELAPGSAALIVLVRESSPDKVLPRISPFGGKMIHTSLSNEAETHLQDALDVRAPA